MSRLRSYDFPLKEGSYCDLVDKEVKNKGCSKIEAEKVVEERIMAILTVDGSNDLKYKSLKVNLANQMVQGVDNYPSDRSKAQTLLAKYIPIVDRTKQIIKNNNHNSDPIEIVADSPVCGPFG